MSDFGIAVPVSTGTFAALFILLLCVLWAVLPGRRRFRCAPAVAMAAALVWLCGCAGPSGGDGGSNGNGTSSEAGISAGTELSGGEAVEETAGERGTGDAVQTAELSDAPAYLPEGTFLDALGFSAGKADAFLLTTAHSAVLIDAGEKGFGKTILAELEARGITKLDYLIITHFDQDHVGGAAKVINNFEVATVLQSNHPKDSEEYEKYVKALNNAGIEAVTVREALDFTLDGVSFNVDPPRKDNYREDDSNNASLIVTVKAGENSLLFMGDAQTERLAEFLEWNTETWDVLKVPHHGKEEPLMEELVRAVQPKYAVITSSDEDPEAASTLTALDGVETFLTRQGEIVITCGDAGLEIGYR